MKPPSGIETSRGDEMTEARVSIESRSIGDGVMALDISGEVTATAENPLMSAYGSLPDGTSTVVLNFAGLEYMNSGGIGLIVTLLVRANRQGQRLMAVGLNDHYRHIFHLTRLDEAVPVHGSEADAVVAAAAESGS